MFCLAEGNAGAQGNFVMSAACQASGDYSGYAGDVSAAQAWEALASDPSAQLIDVRTQPEWVFCGVPSLAALGKDVRFISWKLYPTMELNRDFAAMVSAVAVDKNTPLYFLCKSGGRSLDAAMAMTREGYARCYNIEDGFEGECDASRHRGKINGWKAAQLAWEQA